MEEKKEHGKLGAAAAANKDQNIFRKYHTEVRGMLPLVRCFARLIFTLTNMASFMLLAAMCNREASDEKCTSNDWLLVVLPLSGMVFVLDAACSFFMGTNHERIGKFERASSKGIFDLLIFARITFKFCMFCGITALYAKGKGADGAGESISALYLTGYWSLEFMYLLDPFYKQLADNFAWVNVLLGTSVFNSPHCIKRTERSQTALYGLFWVITLTLKSVVSYYAAFKPLFEVGHIVKKYLADDIDDDYLAIEERTINLEMFGLGTTGDLDSGQGLILLLPLWLMVLCFFFGDVEIW
jgi:hypothetical protein